MNNNNRTARPLCFLIAAVLLVFALASTVNGQTPDVTGKPVGADVPNVIDIWDQTALRAGEGSYGFVPSWFVLIKVRDSHSSYFGSGAFITDRVILTCHHNVRNVNEILVRNGPGYSFHNVKVILQSPKLDLALLRVEDEEVPYHRVLTVSGDNFKPEGTVHSYGFDPAQDAICRFEGKLKGQSYGNPGLKGPVSHSHTARVVPGMSGGPLLDNGLEIVGVNFAHSEQTGSLAVNLKRIQWFLDQYEGDINDK